MPRPPADRREEQLELFGDASSAAPGGSRAARPDEIVAPLPPRPEHVAHAERLPPGVRIGTSSWSFPGWSGIVYDGHPSQARLARGGLRAYARHPLLRTVGLDRS